MSDRKTVVIENGTHRAFVSEHPDQVYLAVGPRQGGSAIVLNPIHALQIAAALMVAAGAVIERQFAEQLGGS